MHSFSFQIGLWIDGERYFFSIPFIRFAIDGNMYTVVLKMNSVVLGWPNMWFIFKKNVFPYFSFKIPSVWVRVCVCVCGWTIISLFYIQIYFSFRWKSVNCEWKHQNDSCVRCIWSGWMNCGLIQITFNLIQNISACIHDAYIVKCSYIRFHLCYTNFSWSMTRELN